MTTKMFNENENEMKILFTVSHKKSIKHLNLEIGELVKKKASLPLRASVASS